MKAIRARWWWLPLGLLVLLPLAGVWLLNSESGLRLAVRFAEVKLDGQLVITEPRGSLAGPLQIRSAHFRNAKFDAEMAGLTMDWTWRALFAGELRIGRLEVQSLRVASPASEVPPAIPASLAAPLEVHVDQLNIGKIVVAPYPRPHDPASGLVIAESVAASIHADSNRIRIDGFNAVAMAMRLQGAGTLEARAPFALEADTEIRGSAGEHAFAVKAKAAGTLAAINISGSAAGEGVSGEFSSRITPFLKQIIGTTAARFNGIDPSALAQGAPVAELNVEVSLQPVAGRADSFDGRITIINAKPGRLDENRLPLRMLGSALKWSDGVLDFTDLRAELHKGGSLAGSGQYARQQLLLALSASMVDAATLHRGAKPTKLSGPVGATLSLNRQRIQITLDDPRFHVAGEATVAYPDIDLRALTVSRGQARLSASGHASLAGTRAITMTGRLENFDPAAFADVPAANLNADIDVAAELGDTPSLRLQFRLAQSRLAGQLLSGRGRLQYANGVAPDVELHLDAAGNRLDATGAWGRAGDVLDIRVDALKLDLPGLRGDLAADVVLSGSRTLPILQGTIRSRQLELPGKVAVRGAHFDAAFGQAAKSEARARLRVDAVDAPAGKLEEIALSLDGTTGLHAIAASAKINGTMNARLELSGGLLDAASAPSWSGRVAQFVLAPITNGGSTGPIAILTQDAAIVANAENFSLGPVALRGRGWRASIQQLTHKSGLWASRGELRGLPLGLLVDAPLSTLTVGGEWDLTFGEQLRGSLRVERDDGDIIIAADDAFESSAPESRVAMGLQTARLDLQATSGRATADLQIAGARLGDLAASLSAQLGASTEASRHLPWKGALRIRTPDLAWASVLIGEGMKVGGQLEGSIALGGTPAVPVVDGRLNGADLSLSTRQQGLNLRDGQMLLDLKDDRVFIRHLKFKSPHQPPPASLAGLAPRRIAELVRLPGTLEVTGESRIGDQNANVELRMDRVGVLQRNDQWVVLSGNGRLDLEKRTLAISGSLRADAAWWELPKRSSISLSDDVVFKQRESSGAAVRQPPLRSRLDLDIQAGELSYFRGAGLESRLTGSLKLSSELGRGLRANGIIQAASGRYDAYGQRLEIERGLINFSGLIDNPGLNIRAMRRRLPVEAGVEVTGTAQRPRIRLVSEPNVADVEKLSWLVQGRAPDQGNSKDSEMLIAAATSILGGDGGVVTELQRKLGIDEFGISSGTLDSGPGKAGTSRVATTGGGDPGENAGTQIVTVGKRLSDNTVLTYEQSIATAESIVKLTVSLSNRLSLVARSGTENALDLFYSFRFGNTSRQR